LPPALGFRGTLLGLFLAACSATPPGLTRGAEGGAAAALETAGAGGSANAASANSASAGATAGDASHAAGAPDVESAGSAGSPVTAGGGSGGKSVGADAGRTGAEENGGKAGDSSAGSGGAAEELMVPCDVDAAYSVCRNCHVDPPLNGAPMPLLTLLDLQTNADAEIEAVSTGRMPAAGTLTQAEATRMLGWLITGAKGVPQTDCP